MSNFTVEIADRIDKAIARAFPGAGRAQIARLFDDGAVRVRGKKAKKGDRVAAGDIVELARAPITAPSAPLPDAEAAKTLVVLLEREDLIAIAKPAGQPSQPLRDGELGTAANAIVARWPECAAAVEGGDVRDGGLVHRLDIGTSGVLIAARTPAAYRALRDAFGAGVVTKHYLAIVEARPVARAIDQPLAQRGKKVAADYTDGLAAHTAFDVVAATETHALVRCTASTGRMHQVRAHLALAGAPIVGDTLYGARAVDPPQFWLHAERVVIASGANAVEIAAPAPEAFEQQRRALGL